MNDPAVSPMTAAELLDLSGALDRLRYELPVLTGFGTDAALVEMDHLALGIAKEAVDRLHRWRKWPTLAAEHGSYLPAYPRAFVNVPQPVQS